jgi:creatinine amidohydrolase/Fe(II)-dependent formamide hydrolase-like protein
MARNGCEKILIMNGHGGNVRLLPLLCTVRPAATISPTTMVAL